MGVRVVVGGQAGSWAQQSRFRKKKTLHNTQSRAHAPPPPTPPPTHTQWERVPSIPELERLLSSFAANDFSIWDELLVSLGAGSLCLFC